MDDKQFIQFKKKHTVVSKKFKAGMITACALLGAGVITTGTLYGISLVNKKDTGGSSEELLEKIATLEKQKASLEKEVKEAEATIAEKTQAIDTLKKDIADKEAQIKDLEGKGAAYEKQIADLKNQITIAQADITKLKANIEALKKDLQQAQADIKTAQEEIKTLNEKLKDAEAEASKLTVMFVDKDFTNKGAFKIAKNTTFKAAELTAPDPTTGYAWKDFDANTTTFSAHTLIHEEELGVNIDASNWLKWVGGFVTSISTFITPTSPDIVITYTHPGAGESYACFAYDEPTCEEDPIQDFGYVPFEQTTETKTMKLTFTAWDRVTVGSSTVYLGT